MSDDKKKVEVKEGIKMRSSGQNKSTDANKMKYSASSGADKSSSVKKELNIKKVDDKKDDKDKEQHSPKQKSPRGKVVVSGSKSPGRKPSDSAPSKSPKGGSRAPSPSTTKDGSRSPQDGSKTPKDGSKSPKEGGKSPKEEEGKSPKDGSKSPSKSSSSKNKTDTREIPPRKTDSSKSHTKDHSTPVKKIEESGTDSETSSSKSGVKSPQRSLKRGNTINISANEDEFLHARLAVIGSRDVWFSMLAQWQGIPLDPKDNPKTFLRTLKVDGKDYLVTAYDYTEKKERRLGANSYVFVFDSDNRGSFEVLRPFCDELRETFSNQRFPCILWNTKRIMDIYAEDLEDATDPSEGADPESIRTLARDLGTGLMPLVSSNVQEQLDVAFNAAIRQGLAHQKFQAAKDEKESKEVKESKSKKK